MKRSAIYLELSYEVKVSGLSSQDIGDACQDYCYRPRCGKSPISQDLGEMIKLIVQ